MHQVRDPHQPPSFAPSSEICKVRDASFPQVSHQTRIQRHGSPLHPFESQTAPLVPRFAFFRFAASSPKKSTDRQTHLSTFPPFHLVTAKPCQTSMVMPIQSRHVGQCQAGSAPSGLRRAPAVGRFSCGFSSNRGSLTRPIGVPIPWFANPRSLAKLETRGMIQDVRKFTPYISGHFMSLKDFVERSVRYNPRIIPMRHSETQNSMRDIPRTCENANARHAASQTYSMPRYMTR